VLESVVDEDCDPRDITVKERKLVGTKSMRGPAKTAVFASAAVRNPSPNVVHAHTTAVYASSGTTSSKGRDGHHAAR